MLLLPRLGHCFKLATSTYQHPVERCLVWFYWCSLSSADTADHVGICSFLLAYPKEVHKPISKQNSTEFPAHSASFHTFPSGESLLWLANLRQLYEKGISDKKNNQRKFEGFPRWTGGANHHCYTRLLSHIHIMLLLPYNDYCVSRKHITVFQWRVPSAIIAFSPLIRSSKSPWNYSVQHLFTRSVKISCSR